METKNVEHHRQWDRQLSKSEEEGKTVVSLGILAKRILHFVDATVTQMGLRKFQNVISI